jgi:hypothetical protein
MGLEKACKISHWGILEKMPHLILYRMRTWVSLLCGITQTWMQSEYGIEGREPTFPSSVEIRRTFRPHTSTR